MGVSFALIMYLKQVRDDFVCGKDRKLSLLAKGNGDSLIHAVDKNSFSIGWISQKHLNNEHLIQSNKLDSRPENLSITCFFP